MKRFFPIESTNFGRKILCAKFGAFGIFFDALDELLLLDRLFVKWLQYYMGERAIRRLTPILHI